jgi:hypothetical protein
MNIFYVYVYLDQRCKGVWEYGDMVFKHQPFYIGKGSVDRMTKHLTPSIMKQNRLKYSKMKSIMNELGEYPLHYKVAENLTECEAFEMEIDMISHFECKLAGGILTNLDMGGTGGSKRQDIYEYTMDGVLINKWCSLTEIRHEYSDTIGDGVGNISTAIKRGGSAYDRIWSYTKLDNVGKNIKYQMPIKYENIKMVDIITKEVIMVYESARHAQEDLGFVKSSVGKIIDCINEKTKTAYGYKWEL